MFFVLTAPIDIAGDAAHVAQDVGAILSDADMEAIRRTCDGDTAECFVPCVICFDLDTALEWQDIAIRDWQRQLRIDLSQRG